MSTEIPDWKQKAESFLISHLDDDGFSAEEAAVYFLSRKKASETITRTTNKAIKRWNNNKRYWSEGEVYAEEIASALRLMQWGEIHSVGPLRDGMCKNYESPNQDRFMPRATSAGYRDNIGAYFPLVFPIFTSDIAIQQLNSKLTYLLHLWQNYLKENEPATIDEQTKKTIDGNRDADQGYATLLSAYIFAAKRLQMFGVDQNILNASVQFLLEHQCDSGLWAYDSKWKSVIADRYNLSVCSRSHVVLGAIGIHAIFVSNPINAKKYMGKAAEWLLRHQHSDGAWYQLDNIGYPNPVYTTVLVLDALEMAEGGDKLTFTPFDTDTEKELLSIIEETQTIIFRGKKIPMGGGGSTWVFFKLLYQKRGQTVTLEELRKKVGVYDIHKTKYDLVNVLKEKGAEELGRMIKNVHSVGYRLEI